MRHIYKLAYCLLLAITVAALAGCSGGGSTVAAGAPPEQPTIVVDAVPTADEAGLYIADDNGYFARQGLTVKIVPTLGGEVGMADLQDGKAQLLAGNYVSFILAQIAGSYDGKPINMRIIANGSLMQPGNQALYVMPGSRFRTVRDLQMYHARIGLNTKDNIGQVLLGSLLRQNGLKLGDIHQVSLQNFPIGAYIGITKWVRSHPNTVAAFLRALQEGQQVADTDRAAVEAALAKNTGTPQVIAATMTLDSYPLTMDVPTMQRVPDAMYEFGLIRKPYSIASMIQPEPGMVR
jgi:NitT/TauT family transport system substrate-binding protein